MKPALLLQAVGVALFVLIGYNFIYVPQRKETRLVQDQLAREQTKQRLATDTADVLEQLSAYRHRLPPEPDSSWLVREVVATAQRSGIELTTISQTAPQNLPQFTFLSVDVQFTATYHQLGAFLDHLERSASFIRVDNLSVNAFGDQGQTAVQASLSTLCVPPTVGTVNLARTG